MTEARSRFTQSIGTLQLVHLQELCGLHKTLQEPSNERVDYALDCIKICSQRVRTAAMSIKRLTNMQGKRNKGVASLTHVTSSLAPTEIDDAFPISVFAETDLLPGDARTRSVQVSFFSCVVRGITASLLFVRCPKYHWEHRFYSSAARGITGSIW